MAQLTCQNLTVGYDGRAVLQGLQPALDRLTSALNSDSGQKLMRGLETLGRAAGEAMGFLLDIVSSLVEFLGNNFQTVVTIAAVAAAVFGAQMLFAAAATMAANWPIILMIGLLTAAVIGLQQAGVTSEQIFGAIGTGVGFLYALCYNLVADLWDVIADFAEFFANVFNDPLAAVARLFFNVFDKILGVVEGAAGALDAVANFFGENSDMAGAVSSARGKMSNWVDDTFGAPAVTVKRMERKDYGDTMSAFSDKFKGLGSSLSDFSLSNAVSVPLASADTKLGNISDSVGKIEKSVNMTDEDIKSLVDMAERRYVNNINLTAQTPVITVNGANTGRTAADRQALADAIAAILVEQSASGAARSTARV